MITKQEIKDKIKGITWNQSVVPDGFNLLVFTACHALFGGFM